MVTLDACASFCDGLRATFGPTASEYILIGAGIALAWWRNRKSIQKVATDAKAGITAAHERASIAETAALTARTELAELRGSLRPVGAASSSMAPTLPPLVRPATPMPELGPLEGSTSASGTYQPVQWPPMPEGVPAPTATNLADPTLPRPSAVPALEDRPTPVERPIKQ